MTTNLPFGPSAADPTVRDDHGWLVALSNIQQSVSNKDLFETNIKQAKVFENSLPSEGTVLHCCSSELVLTRFRIGPVARQFLNNTNGYVLLDSLATGRYLGIGATFYPAAIRDGKIPYIAEDGNKWVICHVSEVIRSAENRGFLNA